MNKLVVVLLENTADLIQQGADKIQEFETSMKGLDGGVKKAALDEFLKGKVAELIKNWNIKQVPDIIEDNYLDPATIELINSYVPSISQSVYNVALKGLNKVSNVMEDISEKIEEKV